MCARLRHSAPLPLPLIAWSRLRSSAVSVAPPTVIGWDLPAPVVLPAVTGLSLGLSVIRCHCFSAFVCLPSAAGCEAGGGCAPCWSRDSTGPSPIGSVRAGNGIDSVMVGCWIWETGSTTDPLSPARIRPFSELSQGPRGKRYGFRCFNAVHAANALLSLMLEFFSSLITVRVASVSVQTSARVNELRGS